MPIEPAGLLALQPGGRLSDLPPTYMTVQHEGRSLVVRPAYMEKDAPEGACMSISLMAFLRSAADARRFKHALERIGVTIKLRNAEPENPRAG